MAQSLLSNSVLENIAPACPSADRPAIAVHPVVAVLDRAVSSDQALTTAVGICHATRRDLLVVVGCPQIDIDLLRERLLVLAVERACFEILTPCTVDFVFSMVGRCDPSALVIGRDSPLADPGSVARLGRALKSLLILVR